ncbi:aspartate/glutamate racemase family protein [Hephaestia sp. GCM10023244]|uniref:aspartate/glutamate racemase family protein n=1 Tax=unclassified Hephaestia TaxID=2631281 RepID=UPI00207780AD|nr:aspartate/glutamate racemase family protein [Hephaestia sp. MAHUQ-44]MCM8732476.1 aspartate/glutamate racemase family protein [Hephaestia sp. MAHUQ-44]
MTAIHLITPVTTTALRNLDEIAHLSSQSLSFTHSFLDRGPPSIECEFDEALAVPDTIRRAIEAERGGADAIIIDCMGDPGLKPAREVVRIPVLGPAETSMHLAAMLGQKFSIVTVLNSVKPMLANLARLYGVHEKLASIPVVDIPVLELGERFEEVKRSLAQAAQQAVERDGADVIVLGCTGFLGCAAAMEEHLLAAGHDVPVIDPIPATVCVAEAITKCGLRHSKRTYAAPRAKDVVGFDIPSIG